MGTIYKGASLTGEAETKTKADKDEGKGKDKDPLASCCNRRDFGWKSAIIFGRFFTYFWWPETREPQ